MKGVISLHYMGKILGNIQVCVISRNNCSYESYLQVCVISRNNDSYEGNLQVCVISRYNYSYEGNLQVCVFISKNLYSYERGIQNYVIH